MLSQILIKILETKRKKKKETSFTISDSRFPKTHKTMPKLIILYTRIYTVIRDI